MLRLFRSLRLREALGLEAAWLVSIALTFGIATWLRERSIHLTPEANVSYSVSLQWDLSVRQIVAVVAIVAAPLLLWAIVRDPKLRDDGK